MPEIREIAFAKINLRLEILGKRPDGYHNIRSIFLPITLADELVLSLDEGTVQFNAVILSCPEVPHLENSDNLVLKALNLFSQKSGRYFSGKLTLTKKIPMEAGLGGGSSDAAAMLRLLNRLVGNYFNPKELACLATQLGSDVPFFLSGKPAWVLGRGEKVVAVRFPTTIPLILVKPDFAISTREAYRLASEDLGLGLTKAKVGDSNPRLFPGEAIKVFDFKEFIGKRENQIEFRDWVKNDFEQVLFPRFPELREIKTALLNEGAVASSITGSGSVVFGAFHNFHARDRALAQLVGLGRSWKFFSVESGCENGEKDWLEP
jgi:4-diphosphocytidyl-2-C-methyl-D-erythritol kinase